MTPKQGGMWQGKKQEEEEGVNITNSEYDVNLGEEEVLVTPEQGGGRQGKKEEEEEGGKSDKERNKPRRRRSLGDSGARRGAARQGRQGRRQSNPQSCKYAQLTMI